MSMPNFGSMRGIHIERFWKNYPSHRTVINYSYKIMQNENPATGDSICEDLHEMASVQSQNLEDIIEELATHKIINMETCQLTAEAYNIIDRIIPEVMGDYAEKLNDYEIYKANKTDRWKLWVEAGTQTLHEMFEPLIEKGELDFYQEDLDYNKGRLLLLDAGLSLPFISVLFLNTERMKEVKDTVYLMHFVNRMQQERRRKISDQKEQGDLSGEELVNALEWGTTSASILAAPTYKAEVVRELYKGELRTPVIGPINLSILAHYLVTLPDDHKNALRAAYLGLLNFLLPAREGFNGILDAYTLKTVIERAFKSFNSELDSTS